MPISGMKFDVVGMASLTISSRMAMARSVVMPRFTCSVLDCALFVAARTFSRRSPLVDAGMKKPTMATMVIIDDGSTRLTR